MRGRLTAIAALSVLLAAAPAPDALRDRLIAEARTMTPPTMAFDRATSAVQTTKSGESDSQRRADRWTGSGWTLLSVNGKPPSADDASKYAKQTKGAVVPGYYRIGLYLAGASTRSTDAQGRTVYHIASLPSGSINVGGDVSDKMAADITVESGPAPYASRLHVYAKAPFRIMLVAKIDSLDTVSDYVRGADGKPVLVRSVNTIVGSQFGKDGTQRSEATYSNVRSIENAR